MEQISRICTNSVQTIAFSTTEWTNYDNRKQFVEEILNEIINQLRTEQYSNYVWKIIFPIHDEQSEFFSEFSQALLTLQAEIEDYAQFFFPISSM